MKKSMIVPALVLALALAAGACARDVTASDEYRALEREIAALEQQASDTAAALAEARAVQGTQVPADVDDLLDEWWSANERNDGSVVELYLPSGYHLSGQQMIPRDDLAAHLGAPGWTPEWITEPYLVAAEPEGRYVVTRGLRNTQGSRSFASALTFEILTTADGELKIAETDWTHATN